MKVGQIAHKGRIAADHVSMDLPQSRIVMVDDQVSFVDAFGLALSLTEDLKLIGRSTTASEGAQLCHQMRPDLLMTDYRLPKGETGTGLARELREAGMKIPIIVLTGFLAPQVRREAASMDNVHAISKDTSVQEIVTLMRSVLTGVQRSGEVVIDLAGDHGLSRAELEVLEALNSGAGPSEIADLLHLSVHTVRGRIKSIYRKLSVSSLGEAIATATRLGVLVPPT